MGLNEAIAWAKANGYDTAEELHLKSGETVFLLMTEAIIGLPRYIRDVGGVFVLCTDDEAMALFGEPDYMREE